MLAELEYDHNVFTNRRAADHKLYVRFYADVMENTAKSIAEGRKIFEDVEMVSIMVPGDKRNVVVRVVRDEDRERFQALYEKFKKGEEEPLNGYPIKEWPLISRAQAEEFKYLGFRTVENLAEASDTVCSKFAGLQQIKQRAARWLEAAKSSAPMEAMAAAKAEADNQIETMRRQMAEMAAQIAKLTPTASQEAEAKKK